jgi:hypothetical protein
MKRRRIDREILEWQPPPHLAASITASPQFDSTIVCTPQTKVFSDPRMEAGNRSSSQMVGPKNDRMNPWIGGGLLQLLAGEISTKHSCDGGVD